MTDTTYDLEAALKVTTTVELVDVEGLGIVVAEFNSPAQADFLAGLVEGFSRFEDSIHRGLQLAYVAHEFTDTPAIGAAVVDLLRDMAEHIDTALQAMTA